MSASFPVVCLGGSAGGIQPLTSLIREIPANAGLAIVVVQHRRGPSELPALLSRMTPMRVQLITQGMSVERDHVYVIPPNCDLRLSAGAFHLSSLFETLWIPKYHYGLP